ncbi:MAG: GAF domain-containing protein [Myxococcales bacterium]|nr:GAF domain-containing protein [Myxococcales bacterium]
MEYDITALDGESVRIEGDNWMLALGRAMSFFDIDIERLERLVCAPTADGSVFVEDPLGGRSWMIRDTAPAIAVHAESTLNGHAESLEVLTAWIAELAPDQEAFWPGLLQLVAERVPCACIAVLLAEEDGLVVVSALGPWASDLSVRRMAFGEGLVGLCFDTRETLVANDVDVRACGMESAAHAQETCLSAACVPIAGAAGPVHGVLQLLNPTTRSFTPAQIHVVNAVSKGLATSLEGGDREPKALRGGGRSVSSCRD